MEIYPDDNSVKEFLANYPLNEQSTVALKLTKIGISYIIKTNGSRRFPNLKELDTIINTLTTPKQKFTPSLFTETYQKKIANKKRLPKEKQFKTNTFAKKSEELKKRAQTVEAKKTKENNFKMMVNSNKVPQNHYQQNIITKDSKIVSQHINDKSIKDPIIYQQNIKTKILKNEERVIQENANQYQKEKEEKKKELNTPQSVKQMQNVNEPIKPEEQISTSNYHFSQENIQTQLNNPEEYLHHNVKNNKEENDEILKISQQSISPQVFKPKLNYDYQSLLTEPHLGSFRDTHPFHHHWNCPHHLTCHCNHRCHNYYHYPINNYYSQTQPAIRTETSLNSYEKIRSKNNYNEEKNNFSLSQNSFHSTYEPHAPFTYEISH